MLQVMSDNSILPIPQDNYSMYTKTIQGGSSLVIESMSKAYVGEYICEATDGVETTDTSTFLYLYG